MKNDMLILDRHKVQINKSLLRSNRNSRLLAVVSGGHSGPTSVDAAGAGPSIRLILPIVRAVTVPIVDGRCRESSEDGSVGKASASDGPLVVSRYRRGDQKERSN